MDLTEDRILADIFQYFWNNHPETRRLIWHVPNEGKRDNGARMLAKGMVAGIQDIHVFKAGKLHVIELKTPTGKVTPTQLKVHEAHAAEGLETVIIRTVADGIAHIKKIFNIP